MQGARRRPWLIPRPSRATPQTALAEPTLRDRTDLPSFIVSTPYLLDPTASAPPRLKATPSRSRPPGMLRQAPGSDYNRAVALSEKQKKHLRRLAHPMSPVVMLGNAGLTDGIVNELDRALTDHELVKVSARVGDRTSRDAALGEMAARTASELVQRVGHVGVFYRRRAELPKILIPD